MNTTNKISLIIPLYNESENVEILCTALNAYANSTKEKFKLEFIFVDDSSEDGTFDRLMTQNFETDIKIVRLNKNAGSHIAFRAGLLHATHPIVTQTSADLQHPLSLIEDTFNILNSNLDGVELVVARRINLQKGSLFEILFSKLYTFLIKKYALSNYPDGGFDIFMFNQRIKDLMNLHIEDNSSILLQMLSFGLPTKFVYYNKLDRKKGKSKWTITKKIKLFVDSFVAFSYMPIRFVSFIGILFFIFGLFWTIYIAGRKIMFDDLDRGWPALTSILLLGFGITNISLGIIAEYLWRTLDVARKRPVFIVEKIVELRSKCADVK